MPSGLNTRTAVAVWPLVSLPITRVRSGVYPRKQQWHQGGKRGGASFNILWALVENAKAAFSIDGIADDDRALMARWIKADVKVH